MSERASNCQKYIISCMLMKKEEEEDILVVLVTVVGPSQWSCF